MSSSDGVVLVCCLGSKGGIVMDGKGIKDSGEIN